MTEIANHRTHLNQDDFDRVIASQSPVLVKFSAKWCGPCKAMEPGLQQLEAGDDFPTVVRVDVEQEVALSERYGVRAMPTLMLFEQGQVTKTQVGALSLKQLENFVATMKQ